MSQLDKQINWKQWKRGLLVAALTGLVLVMVNASAMRKLDGWDILTFIGSTFGASMLNFLQKHPVDDIADTVIIKRIDTEKP